MHKKTGPQRRGHGSCPQNNDSMYYSYIEHNTIQAYKNLSHKKTTFFTKRSRSILIIPLELLSEVIIR